MKRVGQVIISIFLLGVFLVLTPNFKANAVPIYTNQALIYGTKPNMPTGYTWYDASLVPHTGYNYVYIKRWIEQGSDGSYRVHNDCILTNTLPTLDSTNNKMNFGGSYVWVGYTSIEVLNNGTFQYWNNSNATNGTYSPGSLSIPNSLELGMIYEEVQTNFGFYQVPVKLPSITILPNQYGISWFLQPDIGYGQTNSATYTAKFSINLPYDASYSKSNYHVIINGSDYSLTDTFFTTRKMLNGDFACNIQTSTTAITGYFWLENMPMNFGTNTITMVVNMADGQTNTYTFKVIRHNSDGTDPGDQLPGNHNTAPDKPSRDSFPDGPIGDVLYDFAMCGYYVVFSLNSIANLFSQFFTTVSLVVQYTNSTIGVLQTLMSFLPPEVTTAISSLFIVVIITTIVRIRR